MGALRAPFAQSVIESSLAVDEIKVGHDIASGLEEKPVPHLFGLRGREPQRIRHAAIDQRCGRAALAIEMVEADRHVIGDGTHRG